MSQEINVNANLDNSNESCNCGCFCSKCASAEFEKHDLKVENEGILEDKDLLTVEKSTPDTALPKTSTAGLKGAIVFLLLLIMPILLHPIFNLAFSTVLTGSMRPHWNPGDIMITKEIKASDAKVGEVIILQNPNTYDIYSHRVVAITQDKTNPNFLDFSTKGDANPSVDGSPVEINKLAMVPQGIGRIPWVGRILVNFTNNKGKFVADLFILLALGLIGVRLLKNLFKRPKQRKGKNDS